MTEEKTGMDKLENIEDDDQVPSTTATEKIKNDNTLEVKFTPTEKKHYKVIVSPDASLQQLIFAFNALKIEFSADVDGFDRLNKWGWIKNPP